MKPKPEHKPIDADSVDLSHLPKLDGRSVATAKQLADISGRALSQVYATVNIGATKKVGGCKLLDAGSYFDYLRTRKLGRPPMPELETKNQEGA
jgi:hypothetical protein